jgi:hypothetical protein
MLKKSDHEKMRQFLTRKPEKAYKKAEMDGKGYEAIAMQKAMKK